MSQLLKEQNIFPSKEVFFHTKPVGKLIPLIININTREQLTDLLKITKYKKDLTK